MENLEKDGWMQNTRHKPIALNAIIRQAGHCGNLERCLLCETVPLCAMMN